MTHPLREAVARAIAACVAPQIDDWTEQNWPTYLPEAGTAIAATLAGIRKMSVGMVDEGYDAMLSELAKEVAGDADQR